MGGQIEPQSVQFYISTFETTPSYLYQVHSTQYVSYLDPLNMMIFSKIRVPMVKRGVPGGGQMDPILSIFTLTHLTWPHLTHIKSIRSHTNRIYTH